MATQSLVDITTLSPKFQEIYPKVVDFVENECIPNEKLYYSQIRTDENRWKIIPEILFELRAKAKKLGLWNLYIPEEFSEGYGFTNVEYALIAEQMGRSFKIAPTAMNCGYPDSGNAEVLLKFGTPEQKEKWLKPLLEGEIGSAFAMTEPKVASSDATNIETSIRREGDEYVINGRKWWITGSANPRLKFYLVMGKTNPNNSNKHRQQSLVLVPADAPGVTVVRPMTEFGYDDAPHGHCELEFKDVRIPVSNIILGEGRGFEVSQARLGGARIHHCMRSIGIAERALDLMLARVTDPTRRTFGKNLAEHGTVVADIAACRIDIDQARFTVLNAARKMDLGNAKLAMKEIGIAKVVVPSMLARVTDRAMQAHGAGGISQDTLLAQAWVYGRSMRIADGPDAVHLSQLGKLELSRAAGIAAKMKEQKEKSDGLIAKANL